MRVIRLLDPETDPDSVWNDDDGGGGGGHDEDDGDEDDEVAAEDGVIIRSSSRPGLPPGVLDRSRWRHDKTTMRQAFDLLVKQGPRGLTQMQLSRSLGVNKLEARTLCRNFSRRELIFTVMREQDRRQRVAFYVAKQFEQVCAQSEVAKREGKKLSELVPGRWVHACYAGESQINYTMCFRSVPVTPKSKGKSSKRKADAEDDEGFRPSPSKKTPRRDAPASSSRNDDNADGRGGGGDPEVRVSMSEQVIRNSLKAAGAGKLVSEGPPAWAGGQVGRENASSHVHSRSHT